MNKQIEEMARELCSLSTSYSSCEECNRAVAVGCVHRNIAAVITSHDYRKASEGKWKPYKDYFTRRQVGWICSNCSSVTQDLSNGDTDYCPHCGAVMETESEGADDV